MSKFAQVENLVREAGEACDDGRCTRGRECVRDAVAVIKEFFIDTTEARKFATAETPYDLEIEGGVRTHLLKTYEAALRAWAEELSWPGHNGQYWPKAVRIAHDKLYPDGDADLASMTKRDELLYHLRRELNYWRASVANGAPDAARIHDTRARRLYDELWPKVEGKEANNG